MTIYFVGDPHGNVYNYKYAMKQIPHPTEEDKIIVLGDAGLEYGYSVMGSCKKVMKKFPGTWLILRGNHDNRYWRNANFDIMDGKAKWHYESLFGDCVLIQNKYPNIYYLRDEGGYYNIDGYNFLMIPGAYSVDKGYRIVNHLPIEYEEQLTFEELARLEELAINYKDNIDFVCGHTFPIRVEPQLKSLFLNTIDQKSVDKKMEYYIDRIMDIVEDGKNFKQYLGGHFHADKKLGDKYTMLYHSVKKVEDYL